MLDRRAIVTGLGACALAAVARPAWSLAGAESAGAKPAALDLGNGQTLDLILRHVGKLPDPALPAYTELSARFAWRVSDAWELSLHGVNLLHGSHREYPAPSASRMERSVFAEARWRP